MENQDTVALVRSKTDIVDVVGKRIPLIARGKNYFGICPFHDDDNPSLCVSREKQIYTCFSCHATGNVFTFIMNYEHKDFYDALKYLADEVGVEVKGRKKKTTTNTKYAKYYSCYEFCEGYFQNNLHTKVGKLARDYLKKRNIDDKVIKEFKIGLSLEDDNDLTNLLTKKGYDLADLNSWGLSTNNYDIYKDRIMFPLFDLSGSPVGFSGRIYKDINQNKYLNTRETVVFKKGLILYNYHKAQEECRKTHSIIIMEGFMDVIRAWTVGIKNTVALMGTALTADQIKLIKRLSNQVILCLDGDNPGKKATLINGELMLKEKIEVKVVTIPDNDDPDSYILKHGKESFERLLENALLFSDYKMNNLKKNTNFKSIEEKTDYINEVLKEISLLDDEIRIEIMLKKLAKDAEIGYNTLEKRFRKLKTVNKEQVIKMQNKPIKRKNKYQKAIEQLIYSMITNGENIHQVEEAKLIFPEEKTRLLINEINYYYRKYGNINIADFYSYVIDKKELVEILNNILACNYQDDIGEEELQEYFEVIRENSMNLEIKRLQKKIEEEPDPIEQAKICERIRKLRIGEL